MADYKSYKDKRNKELEKDQLNKEQLNNVTDNPDLFEDEDFDEDEQDHTIQRIKIPDQGVAPKREMDIVSKMTIIGIIAVVLLIISITIAALVLGGKDKKPEVEEPEDTTDITEVVDADYQRALAVVKYVDADSSQLMVYDIENMEVLTLSMDSSIVIKDEFGTDIALSQIKLGDMIETKYDVNSMKPESVKITAVTWQRKDISNMIVDLENNTIKIGNDLYTYTEELVTSNNGEPFDLKDLSPADEVIVRGYKDKVWSIVMVNGHGTITLVNNDKYIGGQIEIGKKISMVIEANMTIPVSAGVYNIVVSKDNMTPYVSQVMVNVGEDIQIDLGEAQAKVGTVEFLMMQEGVTLYIDDVKVQSNKPSIMDFGTYKVRAEKENYVTWTGDLILSQAYVQYKVDMEKNPTYLNIQEPKGVEAYLDAAFIGIIPVSTPYTAGEHTITLRLDGYVTTTIPFTWAEDGKDKNLVLPALVPLETQDTTQTDTTTPAATE